LTNGAAVKIRIDGAGSWGTGSTHQTSNVGACGLEFASGAAVSIMIDQLVSWLTLLDSIGAVNQRAVYNWLANRAAILLHQLSSWRASCNGWASVIASHVGNTSRAALSWEESDRISISAGNSSTSHVGTRSRTNWAASIRANDGLSGDSVHTVANNLFARDSGTWGRIFTPANGASVVVNAIGSLISEGLG